MFDSLRGQKEFGFQLWSFFYRERGEYLGFHTQCCNCRTIELKNLEVGSFPSHALWPLLCWIYKLPLINVVKTLQVVRYFGLQTKIRQKQAEWYMNTKGPFQEIWWMMVHWWLSYWISYNDYYPIKHAPRGNKVHKYLMKKETWEFRVMISS